MFSCRACDMFREAINRPRELRGFGSRRQAESRRWIHGKVACLLRTGSRQKRRHEVDCYQGLAHPFGKRRCEVDCYRWLTLLPKSVATSRGAQGRTAQRRFLDKASRGDVTVGLESVTIQYRIEYVLSPPQPRAVPAHGTVQGCRRRSAGARVRQVRRQ